MELRFASIVWLSLDQVPVGLTGYDRFLDTTTNIYRRQRNEIAGVKETNYQKVKLFKLGLDRLNNYFLSSVHSMDFILNSTYEQHKSSLR